MCENAPSTGNELMDAAVAELFALTERAEWLSRAKAAAADTTLSLDQLREIVPQGVLRLAVALAPEQEPEQLIEGLPDERAKEMLRRALSLMRQHFPLLHSHPRVAGEMRRELAAPEDDGANAIAGLGYEELWTEDNGKLIPSVVLRLYDRQKKLLLASRVNWDDLAFLIRALGRILQRHMQKSAPVMEKDILRIETPQKTAEKLRDALDVLKQIRTQAKAFGIEVKDPAEEEAAEEPGS